MASNKNLFSLIIIAILLFLSKWMISFYFFPESLDVKTIFESVKDGKYYFPLIKYLAELNFNNSYDPAISNLKIIPLPITGIIFHAIFYKIIGVSSFIFIELLTIFLFLLIFKKIFSYFFSENYSIVFALFLFIIPSLIIILNLQNFPFINLMENNFYTLRVPRPMISTLYFFTFIYLIISMHLEKFYSKRKFIYLGIIFGLSLSSFYYHFFIEALSFLILTIYKFKKNFIKEIYKNFNLYVVLLIFFMITTAPFLINLSLHENDFTNRQCIFELNLDRKIILTKYFLSNYLKTKFLILFFIISSLTFAANKIRVKNFQIINIFYIIFVASILAPIIFTIISNKTCVMYHFNNLIIVWSIITLFVSFITYFKHFFKFELNDFFKNLLIIFFISIYVLVTFNKINTYVKNQSQDTYRKEFQKITTIIKKKNKLSKSTLMTFDNNLMIWSILNDIKYLNLVNGIFISKTDKMIENDLIKAFKFLNLSSKDFMEFIKNKKQGWRYLNSNVSNFFFYKYQANSLITYQNSKDFDQKILMEISKSSPTLHQQSIIPNFELQRLKDKFLKLNLNNFNEPDIIILNKDRKIFNKIQINNKKYCNLYSGKKLQLYLVINSQTKCNPN